MDSSIIVHLWIRLHWVAGFLHHDVNDVFSKPPQSAIPGLSGRWPPRFSKTVSQPVRNGPSRSWKLRDIGWLALFLGEYTHRSHIQLRVLFCVAKTAKRYDVIPYIYSLMMFSSVDPYHDLSSVLNLDIPSSVPGFPTGWKHGNCTHRGIVLEFRALGVWRFWSRLWGFAEWVWCKNVQNLMFDFGNFIIPYSFADSTKITDCIHQLIPKRNVWFAELWCAVIYPQNRGSNRFQLFLVGGLEHEFYFPFHIWAVILPIDELIFFKMIIAPPTS